MLKPGAIYGVRRGSAGQALGSRQRAVRSTRRFIAILGGCLLFGPEVRAQTEAPSAKASLKSSAVRECSHGRRSALSELACELGRQLPELPKRALLASAPIVSDTPVEQGQRLHERLIRVLAGGLGGRLQTVVKPVSLPTARNLAGDVGTLVYLEPQIKRGTLKIAVDVYPVPKSFWARLKNPHPNPLSHAFIVRALDPELRSFLPPVPLVARKIDKAALPERNPVALLCADVNRDQALEVLVVGRHRVALGRIRERRFSELESALWNSMSSVAATPLREPIAAAALIGGTVANDPTNRGESEPAVLQIGSSDRQYGVQLNGQLELVRRTPQAIPWAPDRCALIEGVSLSRSLVPCTHPEKRPTASGVPTAPDAVAGALLLDASGKPYRVRAGRDPRSDEAWLVDDRGTRASVKGAGAQLAVADLNGDGTPELLTSVNTLDPKHDALVVYSLEQQVLRERFRLPITTGVHALGVCPWQGGGIAPVVVGTATELWVVR